MNSVGQKDPEAFWHSFLKKSGRPLNSKYYEVFHFHFEEKWANELLRLVLTGKKAATSSCLGAYEVEGRRPPQVGDLSIVTDWEGSPKCIIETKAVTIIPFNKMTFELCSKEGEDENLESWREGHIRFFSQEAKDMNYSFNADMPIVFEEFVVVHRAEGELKIE